MDQLLEVLRDMKPGTLIDENSQLIEGGILDSLDVMNLSVELNDEFDIEITPLDILPENFATPTTIYNMIKKLQEED